MSGVLMNILNHNPTLVVFLSDYYTPGICVSHGREAFWEWIPIALLT